MEIAHPILAIDHGEARIGLAATDLLGIATHPAGTINTREADVLEALKEVISQRQIGTLVLGLPLNADGSSGKAVAKIEAFAKQLATAFPGLPLHLVDERFSTMDAASKLRAANRNAKRQKGIIDQAAAMEILDRFLIDKGLLDDSLSPDSPY